MIEDFLDGLAKMFIIGTVVFTFLVAMFIPMLFLISWFFPEPPGMK